MSGFLWGPDSSRSLFLCLGTAWILVFSGAAVAAANEPIKPLPPSPQLDQRKVRLGERLFNDPRFSGDNLVSCASCHNLYGAGGADPRPHSIGAKGVVSAVNAPSVLNAAHNFRQFWDGRAATLEEQIGFVVVTPADFGTTWDAILAKLKQDAALSSEFRAVYPDGITAKNVTDAIVTFERALPAPSRFDRYLLGDTSAITADERKGYEKFKAYGCVACHQGANVGGNMFQVFGVIGNYFQDRGNIQPADLGRYNVTKNELDKYVFKVPSLRNVALTAPYFHDAAAPTLEEAVDVMFKYQLGRSASKEDKALIVKFLKTLTAERLEKTAAGSAAATNPAPSFHGAKK